MKKKYFVNIGRGTLHITNHKSCYNAQHPPQEAKYFNTEEEVISSEKLYIKRCRLCFRNQ